MKLINMPIKTDLEEYHELTDKILKTYSRHTEIEDIYTLGSISDPGISDIDFLFVFKDDCTFDKDIRVNLNNKEKYLLVHNPFGIPNKFLNRQLQYFAPSNLTLAVSNRKKSDVANQEETKSPEILKQIAIEYLMKFYISQSIQSRLNILKVRSLLLEIKAIQSDFNILQYTPDNSFTEIYLSLIDIRKNWFTNPSCRDKLTERLKEFMEKFENYLLEIIIQYGFYLPVESGFRYARNIKLINTKRTLKTGFFGAGRLFSITGLSSSFSFRLASRLNLFSVYLPWEFIFKEKDLFYEKFNHERQISIYNKLHLPNFLPLKSSFNIEI